MAKPFARADAVLAELDRELVTRRSAVSAVGDPDDVDAVVRALRAMVEVDQFIRSFEPKVDLKGLEFLYFNRQASARYAEVDHDNTRAVQAIVARHGWPSRSRFGEAAAMDAWLLVQHADDDVPFQKRVLALMEPLVPRGEASASNVAYLVDRVAVNEGRAQRYGTQGTCTPHGTWEPHPIEDAVHLDQRRAAVGLEAIADYRARFAGDCQR